MSAASSAACWERAVLRCLAGRPHWASMCWTPLWKRAFSAGCQAHARPLRCRQRNTAHSLWRSASPPRKESRLATGAKCGAAQSDSARIAGCIADRLCLAVTCRVVVHHGPVDARADDLAILDRPVSKGSVRGGRASAAMSGARDHTSVFPSGAAKQATRRSRPSGLHVASSRMQRRADSADESCTLRAALWMGVSCSPSAPLGRVSCRAIPMCRDAAGLQRGLWPAGSRQSGPGIRPPCSALGQMQLAQHRPCCAGGRDRGLGRHPGGGPRCPGLGAFLAKPSLSTAR